MEQKILERAQYLLNMKTVFTRLDKRGHIALLKNAFNEIKQEEESLLNKEVNGDCEKVFCCMKVFKENFKVFLSIIGIVIFYRIVDELWKNEEEFENSEGFMKQDSKLPYMIESVEDSNDKSKLKTKVKKPSAIINNSKKSVNSKSLALKLANNSLFIKNSISSKEKTQIYNNLVYVHYL